MADGPEEVDHGVPLAGAASVEHDEPVAVRAMYEAGQRTIEPIAAERGVSRPTVYRSLKRTESQNQL